METIAEVEKKSRTPWALVNLPPFPSVAIKLVRLLSDEDADIQTVSKFIASEPVFSMEVLRLANSVLFGAAREIKSIPAAVVHLGTERVKGVAMTVGLRNYVSNTMRTEALAACWRNSLACALICEQLAAACGEDQDFGYTAGLLHDIGRLALLVKYPQPYANLLSVAEENCYQLISTERELFDIDHCEAGGWLVERLGLPEELLEVAAKHHDDPAGPFRMVHLVRVGDIFADALGFSIVKLREPPAFEAAVAALPEHARRACPQNPVEWRKELVAKIAGLR